MRFLKINDHNISVLKDFISDLSEEKIFFRYYNSRSFSVINKHLLTYLLLDNNNQPMCYGHIDIHEGKHWLGVVTKSTYQKKGLGKKMINKLIKDCKELHVNAVYLSCDKDNLNAFNLYKKIGFTVYSAENKLFFMKKVIL